MAGEPASMDTKNITKQFKNKIRNRALSDANKLLDSDGERMKTFSRIFLTIGIVAFSLPAVISFWQGLHSFFYFFLSLLIADVVFLVGSFIYPRVIAYFNMWNVAAQQDNEQQKTIHENQELIDYLKSLERLGRGDLIHLNQTRESSWIGIEIHNGEKGNPFNADFFVIECTGHSIPNPISMGLLDGSGAPIHVLSGGKSTIRLIELGGDFPRIIGTGSYTMNPIKLEKSGEYIITTQVHGSFWSPSIMVDIKSKWKFIVNNETKVYDLEMIDERVEE